MIAACGVALFCKGVSPRAAPAGAATMIQAADVRSIDDLRDLHAYVCKFRSDAQDALAAVEMTIRRAHDWLHDKLQFWQRAIRAGEDDVFKAKQELKQRQYVGFDGRVPDCTVQEENLKRAQGKLRFAQERAEITRGWMSRLPKMISETYEGPARQLAASIEGELPRALAVLEKRIDALEKYAAIMAPQMPRSEAEPPPSTPAAEASP